MDNELSVAKSLCTNKLIFPKKKNPSKDEVIRYSEQECRVLFILEIEKEQQDIFYSVETPTQGKYSFSGKTDNVKSALTDLTLFIREENKYKRKLNIEFKYKNCKDDNIYKDIEKLITEQESGLFFHVLKNINRATLINSHKPGLFDKFQGAIDQYKYKWKSNKSISFVICIIEKKMLLFKTLNYADLDKSSNFFTLDFPIPSNTGETQNRGWKVIPL